MVINNTDSLIIGEGVANHIQDSSPFRLTTSTKHQQEEISNKFSSLISTSKKEDPSSNPANGINEDENAHQPHSLSSFSTLKSKIKAAVQDKYRKSSNVGKQIQNKFHKKSIKNNDNNGNDPMSKFRSHSHGALPNLSEFHVKDPDQDQDDHDDIIDHNDEEEDDINGIWSASQLASKQAKENANKRVTSNNANTASTNAIQNRQVNTVRVTLMK